MESLETWEKLVLGGMAVALMLLMRPGLKDLFRRSHEAPKDWSGLFLPLGLVIFFVVVLVLLT